MFIPMIISFAVLISFLVTAYNVVKIRSQLEKGKTYDQWMNDFYKYMFFGNKTEALNAYSEMIWIKVAEIRSTIGSTEEDKTERYDKLKIYFKSAEKVGFIWPDYDVTK